MTASFPPSIWADTAPPRNATAALTGDIETDVAVIGGGFTGLSTALHLARKGKTVTVLEAKAVGWGASGRNNGQVIPTLTAAEPDMFVARYGEAGTRFANLIGNSASILFDLVRQEDMDAEAEQSGWFQPAHSPGRVRLSQARVDAWQRFGFPAEFLSGQQTADLLGSDFWYGGMLNPTGGHVNPLALARGMAKAAEHHGAVIYEDTPVTGWERKGASWIISTDQARITARAFVLATNAYTGELVPKLAPKLAKSIVPVLSWQMASEPVGSNVRASLLPGRQAVSDTRGDLRFFRYNAQNQLITGGAVMGFWNMQDRVRAKAAGNLAQAFPQLGQTTMTHVWSGYIGMTWDRFPRVHKLGPDAWAWIACNGRGVALGTALGRELAEVVSGTPEQELALPISEPRPLPMHSLARKIAPTYLAWLKRKDATEPKP